MKVQIAVLAAVAVCLALTAEAASITNKDGQDRKLTISEGSATSSQVLKAGAALDGVCLKGCVVRIGDGPNDEYELEPTDTVSIEDGLLYSDGADGTGAPAAGGKPPTDKR